ncbi:MAG: FAD:protein FMN transferase, partial [Planctomycetota bacterium]|nr:FAD:protein FMN transferase [Planctomycetota bacterium]
MAGGMKRELRRGAFSGSGRGVLGDHIVDPRTGRAAKDWWRCWAGAERGAVADGLSTAFMVMPEDEIRRYCVNHPGTSAYGQRSESGDAIAIAEITR